MATVHTVSAQSTPTRSGRRFVHEHVCFRERVPQMARAGAFDGWGMTMVVGEVVPWLRERGVWDEATGEQVFGTNPSRCRTPSRRAARAGR